MDNTEIENWFNKFYWPSYPADLCGSTAKKGSKAEALNIIKTKIKPDKDLMDLMSKNLSAQIIEARKDNDPARFPFLTTYLNKKRYLDTIEQEIDGKPVKQLVKCSVEGCLNDVHGPDYQMCTDHLPAPESPVLDRMRAFYKDQLIKKDGETKEDHVARLRSIAKRKIKGLVSMPVEFK